MHDISMCALLPARDAHPVRLTASTSDPRFYGAAAWLRTYLRDPASSTNDGPPSLWSIDINADFKAAVVACVGQSSTGDCACSGTSCSSNPRYNGPIGTWDVSGVRNMRALFYTSGSQGCTIYCNFNADISEWDSSSVTTTYGM